MARSSKRKEAADYAAEIRRLREKGPQRLYLLYGEEDYLREQFLGELIKLCVEPGTEEFNHRRTDGDVPVAELARAVDALPFFAERTLVEVRGFDVNKCRDQRAEELKGLASDIPDYCTVAFVLGADYVPDGRLAAVKTLKKYGAALEFARQEDSALYNWIARRFSALGKKIGRAEAERLVFLSGGLMTGLIPEIEKVAQYAGGDAVTLGDIDAVAHHLPEAEVFEMTDLLARRDFDGALAILAELLQMKNEHPIKLLAVIGQQVRNLYAARLAVDEKLGRAFVAELTGRPDFVADRLMAGARSFSRERLERAVRLCADCDYAMKSSASDDKELVKELVLKLAADV